MNKGGEESGQIVLMNWLRRQDIEVWKRTFHTPNGGLRGKRESATLKLMGVKAGVSDLITLRGNESHIGIVQELKAKDGRLAKAQVEWIGYFEEIGFKCYVPYSLEEAIENYCEFFDWDERVDIGGKICGFE